MVWVVMDSATIVSTMDINSLGGVHFPPKASGAIATSLLTQYMDILIREKDTNQRAIIAYRYHRLHR